MKRYQILPLRWLSLVSVFLLLVMPGQAWAGTLENKSENHISLQELGTANESPLGNISQTSTNVTINLVNDTVIDQANPNTNYGSKLGLMVGRDNGNASRMLLDLPLWDLPPNGEIQSATLKIFVSGWADYTGHSRVITAYRAASLWQENNATWNHAPLMAEAVGSVSIGMPAAGAWYDIDLTQAVKNWYAGTTPDYGVVLVGPESEDVYRILSSTETTTAPYLNVTYTLQPPTLSASPLSLTFLMDGQQVRPATNSILIQNTGSQPLDWDASTAAPWLSILQTGGTLGPGASASIPVGINPSGLIQGNYDGTVSVTSSTPGTVNPTQNAQVSLRYVSTLNTVSLPLVTRGTAAGGQKIIGLYIGISDYKYLQPALNGVRAGSWGADLLYASNDAKQTAATFAAISFFNPVLGGSSTSHQYILTDSSATLKAERTTLDQVAAEADSNTIVIIHFSGHGGQTPDLDGDESDGLDEFISAYDSNLINGNFTNIMTDDELKIHLDKIQSQETIVFLDSCNSGGMVPNGVSNLTNIKTFNWSPGSTLNSFLNTDSIAAELAGSGRVILTASKADQLSIESPKFNQGVFSYYLTEAFTSPSADTNQDGWISVQEAYAYLLPRVEGFTSSSQSPQIFDSVGSNVNLTHP